MNNVFKISEKLKSLGIPVLEVTDITEECDGSIKILETRDFNFSVQVGDCYVCLIKNWKKEIAFSDLANGDIIEFIITDIINLLKKYRNPISISEDQYRQISMVMVNHMTSSRKTY